MGRRTKVPTIDSFSGDGAKEYTTARWMARIQKTTTRRALELMNDGRIGGPVDRTTTRGWLCLDLGCGNGYSTDVLHEAGFTGTVGLDVSEEMLLARDATGPVVLGDIQHLPFRPSSFNCILSISALNFISQDVQAENDVRKIYKDVAR
nr:class I SAM-dependent methyltransferase [Candidatus Sigynarchaeota archaeon]